MSTYLSMKIKQVDPWMRFGGKTAYQSKNNQILIVWPSESLFFAMNRQYFAGVSLFTWGKTSFRGNKKEIPTSGKFTQCSLLAICIQLARHFIIAHAAKYKRTARKC